MIQTQQGAKKMDCLMIIYIIIIIYNGKIHNNETNDIFFLLCLFLGVSLSLRVTYYFMVEEFFVLYRGNKSSRCSCNSEANASELQENLEHTIV